jgi:hypothetical protein
MLVQQLLLAGMLVRALNARKNWLRFIKAEAFLFLKSERMVRLNEAIWFALERDRLTPKSIAPVTSLFGRMIFCEKSATSRDHVLERIPF